MVRVGSTVRVGTTEGSCRESAFLLKKRLCFFVCVVCKSKECFTRLSLLASLHLSVFFFCLFVEMFLKC
jgi:hypothetical protein